MTRPASSPSRKGVSMSTPLPVRSIAPKYRRSAPAIIRINAAPVRAGGREVGRVAGRGVGTPGTGSDEGGGMSFIVYRVVRLPRA